MAGREYDCTGNVKRKNEEEGFSFLILKKRSIEIKKERLKQQEFLTNNRRMKQDWYFVSLDILNETKLRNSENSIKYVTIIPG